ncbi:hypothetical protein KSP39_PZI015150 [Platanthera zijinensis]|uniref:Programmed cell death protein 2 C-terminal domain-containing protein n=1 Tax=Platanthera zijinensis TaxID=2320716 RepID=A0AAP0BAQ9_9ASPA
MERVILGMPGQWAQNFLESSDHYTTKIGGLPDWPISEMFIKSDLLKCVLCGERLCLIAQIYAPISTEKSNIDERVIYLFGCMIPKCGSHAKCWRALRVQQCNSGPLYDNHHDSKPSTNCNGEGKLFVSPNGVSFEENSVCGSEEVTQEAYDDLDFDELARELSEVSFQVVQSKKAKSSLSLEVNKKIMQPKQTVNKINYSIPVVPCFYIYPHEDRSVGDTIAVSANYDSLLTKQDDNSSKDNQNQEFWGGEEYEYDKAVGVDRTFLKFKKRMDACPEQCFRYSYGGNPLLVKPELKEPSPCNLCGSPRQFEMQLMPPLLYFLLEGSDGLSVRLPEEWNWMTILVYTCSSSCCQGSPANTWAVAEEEIIIQDD